MSLLTPFYLLQLATCIILRSHPPFRVRPVNNRPVSFQSVGKLFWSFPRRRPTPSRSDALPKVARNCGTSLTSVPPPTRSLTGSLTRSLTRRQTVRRTRQTGQTGKRRTRTPARRRRLGSWCCRLKIQRRSSRTVLHDLGRVLHSLTRVLHSLILVRHSLSVTPPRLMPVFHHEKLTLEVIRNQ